MLLWPKVSGGRFSFLPNRTPSPLGSLRETLSLGTCGDGLPYRPWLFTVGNLPPGLKVFFQTGLAALEAGLKSTTFLHASGLKVPFQLDTEP